MNVYEVFRQEREGEPMTHSGSLLAPSDDLARQYARDIFSRRGEALRIWVVPRAAIGEVDEPDLLKQPLDHTYRVPAGYTTIAEKVRAVKASVAGREGAREAEPAEVSG